MDQFLQTLKIDNPDEDNLYTLYFLYENGLTEAQKTKLVNLDATLRDNKGLKVVNPDLLTEQSRYYTLMLFTKVLCALGFMVETNTSTDDYVDAHMAFGEDEDKALLVSFKPTSKGTEYTAHFMDNDLYEKSRPDNFDEMSMEDRLKWSLSEGFNLGFSGCVENDHLQLGFDQFLYQFRKNWTEYVKLRG